MAIFSSRVTTAIRGAALSAALLWAALLWVVPSVQAAERVAKTYPIKDVFEVAIGGNTLLEITQDGTEYLRVEATPEAMDRVKVDLTGHRLTLGVKSKGGMFGWFGDENNKEQVRFVLRVKQLTFVDLSGAARGRFGDLQGDDFMLHASGAAGAELASLNVKKFLVQLSGASNLSITNVNSKYQDLGLSGASNMEIKQDSYVGGLKADLSGASNLRARKLKANSAELGASGASHIEVSVSESLKAEASGASSIDYYGNPKAETDSSGASHVNARKDD